MDPPTTPPLLPMAIYTAYSTHHLPERAFSNADSAFQVGAVVINEDGHALAFRDPETGALQLPISDVSSHFGDLVRAPLKFVEEQTGLNIERLPLRQAKKRYRNPDAFRWECVEEDLIFKDDTTSTTNPFSVGLDLAWYNEGTSHSLRQAVISWYGGVVQGQQDLRTNQCFMPVRDLLLRMRNQRLDPTVHIDALSFFEQLWHATEGK
ncbi:hypothetical protein EXIGLDRAFT_730711 [Exidia glandulosa HHB12029]|uniref:Nudix hydrolase domain-containing protein n=1 Tax=Exidia glandulosa HHB12029 TaxID=1314781 RepID=A0A165ZDN3_EXIGL|nr:hypothetical protein EXIGLDRAFT_730711 [Exidia glandulosa HHB12029]